MDGKCVPHAIIFPGCSKIDEITKRCEYCLSTHFYTDGHCCLKNSQFWNSTNKTCVDVTSPVAECEEHISQTTCQKCKDTHILASNTLCCGAG